MKRTGERTSALTRRGVDVSCIMSVRDISVKGRREVEGTGEEGDEAAVEEEGEKEGVFAGVRDIKRSFADRGCACRMLHKCLYEDPDDGERYFVSVMEFTPPPC